MAETQSTTLSAATLSSQDGQLITQRRAYYFLGVLALVNLVNFVDRQILSILLVPIQDELHVSDTAMGLLTGFGFALFYVTAGLPMARWCDTGNRRNILSLAVTIWSASTILCGTAVSYTQLLVTRFGVALGEAAGNPASISMISDLFPLSKRATAISVYYVGAASGIFVGMWLGGTINEAMGWRAAFIAVGAPGLVLALVLRFTVFEPRRGASDGLAEAVETPSLWSVQRYLWSVPTFRFVILGNAFHSLAAYSAITWSPAFFIRVHEMSTAEVGFWVGIVSGGGYAFGNLFGGYIADLLGRRHMGWYMGISGLLMIAALPFLLLFVFSDATELALFAFFPLTALIGASTPPIAAVTQALAKPSMRAMSFGTQYFVTALFGMGGGPFFVGLANDFLAPIYGTEAVRYSLFGVGTLALMFCALFFSLGARTSARDIGAVQDQIKAL